MTETTTFDFTKTYTAEGYGGIAFRATEFETETTFEYVYCGFGDEEDDESYDYVEDERLTGRIVAHMVGDDRDFTFDADDLTAIDEDDYCAECGQVGCTADGRERG